MCAAGKEPIRASDLRDGGDEAAAPADAATGDGDSNRGAHPLDEVRRVVIVHVLEQQRLLCRSTDVKALLCIGSRLFSSATGGLVPSRTPRCVHLTVHTPFTEHPMCRSAACGGGARVLGRAGRRLGGGAARLGPAGGAGHGRPGAAGRACAAKWQPRGRGSAPAAARQAGDGGATFRSFPLATGHMSRTDRAHVSHWPCTSCENRKGQPPAMALSLQPSPLIASDSGAAASQSASATPSAHGSTDNQSTD